MSPGDHLARQPIPVLYEDKDYMVFNKPAGLLVIPTPKKEKTTLLSLVNEQCSGKQDQGHLYPCHRLDRETSGVILFARGKHNQRLLTAAFRQRSVRKKYIAMVHKKMKAPSGEIKSVIEDLDQKKFSRKSRARLAITRYRVLTTKHRFSIVEVYPLTGRTNQIRIHFKEIGHPLVGESKYAFRKDFELKFRRAALHASELVWFHPIRKKTITTAAPLPKDMEAFIAKN